MVGWVRQRAQGGADGGHPAVARAVDLEQGGALGDGHRGDVDLLDPAVLGQPAARVARPVTLAAIGDEVALT
jgi:hypothetical protein